MIRVRRCKWRWKAGNLVRVEKNMKAIIGGRHATNGECIR